MTEDDMASSSDTSLDAHLNGRRRITEATLSPPSNNPISLLSSPQGEEQDSSPATVLNQKHEQEVEEKRDKASASLAGKITAADSVSGSSEFDGLVKETNISGEEVQETEDASVNVVEERAFSKSVEKDEFLAKGVEEEDSLEVRKKRLLAELEAMSMQGDKEAHLSKVTEENSPSYSSSLVDEKRNLCKDVIIKMVKNEAAAAADKIGVTGGPLRSSLEFEVIDETALIGSVLINRKEKYGTKKTTTKVFPRKVQVELLENNVNVNFNVDGPTKKISRRRAKEAERKTKGMNQEENVDMSSNGGKRKYSRGQMESLRFVKVFEQRKLWKEIYEGLGLDLAKEYDGLTVSFNSSTFHKKPAPAIVGDECNDISPLGPDSPDEEDSDEDYSSIQRPAFFVEGEPDFESGPPEDGLEYLRRVRWEAKRVPKVKIAKLDIGKINKEQSAYMPKIPDIPNCPDHLLPSKQWEDAFLADFADLHLALSHPEEDHILHDTPESVILHSFDIHFPPQLQTSSSNTSSNQVSSEYPLLSTITEMDPVVRVSTLKKRIRSLEDMMSLLRSDCAWIFVLCAAVDTPLDADSSASIRSLLRKCASLRAEKSEVDDEVIMLNILITISGRFFGQSQR